ASSPAPDPPLDGAAARCYHRPVSSPDAGERQVCFHLAGQEFGLPIDEVKETIEPRPITRIFLVPDFIAGLINLRGDVLAVLDLGRVLDCERLRAFRHRSPAAGAARPPENPPERIP